MPTFEDAFQDYMSANPNRSESTNQLYNYDAKHYLRDWLSRPLDSITSGEPGANPAAFRQHDQGGIRLNGSSFGTPSGHTKAGFGFANSVNSRTLAGRLSM